MQVQRLKKSSAQLLTPSLKGIQVNTGHVTGGSLRFTNKLPE
jgi:hypothetical protein